MDKVGIGIIGGTGIYKLPGVQNLESREVQTDYGKVKVNLGTLSGVPVAFLTRHGENHSVSPGQINYRGNIQAMQRLGVQNLLATACSGSLNREYGAGSFVLLEQFIEFTKNRPDSFFLNDGTLDRKIAHVDLTHPYCKRLGGTVLQAGGQLGIPVKTGATYCCMEGPRFESDAEIKMLQTLGADLVAQTQYPEVVLAREAQMCYAAIGIVSNMAAGVEDDHVNATDLKAGMAALFDTAQSLLAKSVELLAACEDCWCKHALEESYL